MPAARPIVRSGRLSTGCRLPWQGEEPMSPEYRISLTPSQLFRSLADHPAWESERVWVEVENNAVNSTVPPGTGSRPTAGTTPRRVRKKRMPLFDEKGQRIRGKENQEAAETALAKVKVASDSDSAGTTGRQRWLVAKVCSEYLQYCERGVANNTLSKGHRDNAVAWLNDLCGYCGALPVAELKKGTHQDLAGKPPDVAVPGNASQRCGNRAGRLQLCGRAVRSPQSLKGLKKPASQPRLHSLSKEDEEAIYGATEERFREFLFAAIHTGLRPFCELARVTADDVEENGRGMMWRVYSSKTKKTRKIPVRPEVAELTRKLMKTAPRGSGLPLFRNTKGKPWKRMTGVVRFLTLKKKLGWDQDPTKTNYSCYTCRHTFAHRMLSGYWSNGAGCSIETLAELDRRHAEGRLRPLWSRSGGNTTRSPYGQPLAFRPICMKPRGTVGLPRILKAMKHW